MLPAVLNLCSLLCQLVALVYIPAAVLAGLRGFFILFTAGLSKALGLKDRPRSGLEWYCIGMSAFGALMVGAGSELQAAFVPSTGNADAGGEGGGGGKGMSTNAAINVGVGAAASLIGYAFAAGQVAVEQILLDAGNSTSAKPSSHKRLASSAGGADDDEDEPVVTFTKWQILGIEGIYGLVLCGVIMLALRFGTQGAPLPLDDPQRTLCCLKTTPTLSGLSAAYGASSLTFNASLLALSSAVGPNYRVFVFTARGVLTWVVEILLFYLIGGATGGSYGEGLSPFSALILCGYVLLIGSGLWRVRLQAQQAATPPSTPNADGAGGDGKAGFLGLAAPLLVTMPVSPSAIAAARNALSIILEEPEHEAEESDRESLRESFAY